MQLDLTQRRAGMLEVGMWVVHCGRIGIVAAMFAGAMCRVNFVEQDGTTSMREDGARVDFVIVPFDRLRQARLEEIPACRRPDDEAAAIFGYA